MYRVAICDDEADFAEFARAMAHEILEQAQIPHTIEVFTDAQNLLDVVQQRHAEYSLLLLDILMGEKNGIRLAKKLRAIRCASEIVFITSSKEFALDGYEVRAKRYILKPVDRSKLQEVLLDDYESNYRNAYLVLSKSMQILPIRVAEICYIESATHKVLIHMRSETISWSCKLQEIEEELPAGRFVRCHKSYIVNASEIKTIRKNNVYLLDGAIVPISKNYLSQMREEFYDYLG